jgi:hypothetical protein
MIDDYEVKSQTIIRLILHWGIGKSMMFLYISDEIRRAV